MSTPTLATKLYIPPLRRKVVLRPRLVERLNEGLSAGCKVTLISASAGFGKTTLVSEWVDGCGRPVAWLSLDEGDNDPVRFLTYLVAALQTLALRSPRRGSGGEGIAAKLGAGVLGALQSPEPPPAEALLTALINEIAAISEPFALVLDDYHVIEAKPVDHALAFLVEHMPPQMHLVIATRCDPQLPIARLRARGQLTELRAADLRFTSSEAAEYLNPVMGLNLSAEDSSALESRAEGWIAGLQLAALSMQGKEDVAGFIREFAGDHRYIVDYLVEEVLQSQPEPVRNFLLRTAILDRLNGSLCDAVTGNEDGSARLEALQRGNFFLIPLDDRRAWYRYHPLFADVLRLHLKAEQPDQGSALHRRASEWYEQNGSAEDAIRHALAGRDFERAANLVELAKPAMTRNGHTATLLGWLKQLPYPLLRTRPVLSVDYASALMASGDLGGVEARLRDAERWLVTPAGMRERPEAPAEGTRPERSRRMVVVDREEYRRLPAMIAMIRAAQALARGDMPDTVVNARRVLDLAPEDDHLLLGGAASQLGLAAWTSGDLEAARRMTADGMTHLRLAGYISPAIGGAIVLADIQIAQGCLHEAMTTYEQALQWAVAPAAPSLAVQGAADMHVGMSDLHREHNDLNAATQHLLKSQALGELAGSPQYPYRWCAAMARIRQAQGDPDGALDLLDRAERLYDANFSPNVRPIATRKVRVWLAQGRLDEALGWARAQGLSVEDELSYLHEFDHITLARVHLARYRRDRADGSMSGVLGLLARLLKAAQEGGRQGSVIEIGMLQAMAYHARDDLPAALFPLQRALALAEPEGYIRIFLDEGSSMMQLLREASARKIMPGYTDRLLAAFAAENRLVPAAGPGRSEDKPDLPSGELLIEPLSRRELEVLQLIARGLSNREIGERLFLALDTVKGHNRNIFDKLQVRSRTEATVRARELGLL
jgi:ATP/maltotriose-dependent transcriptional regulator MalT